MKEDDSTQAKGQMIALMQAGHPWKEAAAQAGLRISRSATYRLLQKVRVHGEAGLRDGRHGHSSKVREPVRQWLKDSYQADPQTPSHVVQQALLDHFGIRVSVSHLNAVRATLGRGSHLQQVGREKNGSHT